MRLKLYRGKWAAVGYDAEGRVWRRSLGTADRAAAERKFKDIRVETPGDTIAQAVTIYLRERQEKPSYSTMEASWKALKPMVGHLRPDQITPALCREFARKRRAAGRKNGTVIKDLSFLRTALKFAKKHGAEFEFPPAPAPRDRHLTRAEFDRLLAACKLPHIRLFVILALATGGRASAIMELTWDRVDFERGQIKLGTGERRDKGRATVPMNDRARAALTAAYQARESDYVVEWAGQPVRSVKTAFREAVERAGLTDVSPHVLRHTCAVWLVESGQPIEAVAQYLGHTNPQITFRTYARFSPTYLKAAAKALD